MNQISVEDYLAKRVDDQIAWYSQESGRAQRSWKRLRLAEVLAAALIPFAAAYAQQSVTAQIAVGLLGVIVALVTGALGVYKFQENWLLYRSTAEALKREKFLVLTGVAPYNGEHPEREFVARVEAILGKEGEAWQQATAKTQQPAEKPAGA